MKNLFATLKQKKVWIPLSIVIFLFFGIAACAYFLSRVFTSSAGETPDLRMSDIIVASIDPEKRHHLQRAEVSYFEAEKYVSLRDYRKAHDYFSESTAEWERATGKDSPVACTMAIRQAQFESKHRKWDEAEFVLRRALANLPPGARSDELTFRVNRWLGYVLQCHRKYKDAIQTFAANVQLGDRLDKSRHLTNAANRSVALKALSSCYVAAGQYDNATNTANELMAIAKLQPDSKNLQAESWIEVGRIKGYAKNYVDAIDSYNKALSLDPKCIEALRARGTAYNELKQYRNAISDFSILLKLNDRDENAYEWRAYDYELNGEKEKAIDDLTLAIKIGGSDQSPYDNRARLYAELGRYKEAIADYGLSIEQSESPWAYMYRAQAYEKLNQHKEAIQDYSKAIEFKYFVAHPNHPDNDKTVSANYKTMGALVYARRAKCYDALGDKGLAAADRARSVKLDQTKPAGRYMGGEDTAQKSGGKSEIRAEGKSQGLKGANYENVPGDKVEDNSSE